MNSFYKEQEELMEKALTSLQAIRALDIVVEQFINNGEYRKSEISQAHSKRLEELQTDYALTITTLMQNFCSEMGFVITKKPGYLTPVES